MNAPASQGTLMGKGLSALWAPFSPANRINPYPMYQALRELGPVHQLKTGDWVVTRYADVCTVLMDKRFDVIDMPSYFRYKTLEVDGAVIDLYDTYRASYNWLLYLRRPMHGRTREIVMKIWPTLQFVENVQAVVTELAGQMAQKTAIDLIDDFAKPLPVMVISRLMGFPETHLEELKYWGERLATIFEPMLSRAEMLEINQAAADFLAFVDECLKAHEQKPANTLIGKLLQQRSADGQPIDRDDLISLIANLFVAGEETTRNLIGNGFAALTAFPDQMALLQQHRELLKPAVEEMLRYDGPVQITSRIALEDAEVSGRLIRAGEQLYVCLGSAGRDEQQFENSDRLDITRSKNKHLAFGYGSHFCLGASLARMQGMQAFQVLLDQFPDLRADLPRAVQRRNLLLRGFGTLPTVRI
ncbi:cytochrome P450 [Larkinella bovis]|uniref:Cytochrome P450 n=1 Tax=Larkinella bovis TaxID=683041 RepID=A0ABW0IJD1_9BACT